ncbi:MAG TPA: YkvA family protein [Allosphingosinicella sp.]|nr:YkvA family protein [Allosphingosinicella sp.]
MPEENDHPSLVTRLRIEAHAVWLVARDPRTPWPARLIALLTAAYALSPIDLVPDFIPILGLIDDALMIPAGIWLVGRLLPPGLMDEHRAAARAAADRPVSKAGMLIVIAIWVALAALVGTTLHWAYA